MIQVNSLYAKVRRIAPLQMQVAKKTISFAPLAVVVTATDSTTANSLNATILAVRWKILINAPVLTCMSLWPVIPRPVMVAAKIGFPVLDLEPRSNMVNLPRKLRLPLSLHNHNARRMSKFAPMAKP